MRYTAEQIGGIVKATRKHLKVTQKQLALTAGTGLRFISDLEQGKSSCELGKVLQVINTLGIDMQLLPPGEDIE